MSYSVDMPPHGDSLWITVTDEWLRIIVRNIVCHTTSDRNAFLVSLSSVPRVAEALLEHASPRNWRYRRAQRRALRNLAQTIGALAAERKLGGRQAFWVPGSNCWECECGAVNTSEAAQCWGNFERVCPGKRPPLHAL